MLLYFSFGNSSLGVNLSATLLNEADQELEIKWAKNRPSSPLSTSPSPNSPSEHKHMESMFFNHSLSESSEIASEQNAFNLFGKLEPANDIIIFTNQFRLQAATMSDLMHSPILIPLCSETPRSLMKFLLNLV